MSVDRMDRLRELRALRRTVAERDAERARNARAEFEKRVSSAQEAHARAVHDATGRRRAAVDALMAEPTGPLGVARMSNVHAVIDNEIVDAARAETNARDGLESAEADLAEKRDVLAAFLKRETAMDYAVERLSAERDRVAEEAEGDGEG